MKLLLNLGPIALICLIIGIINYRHQGAASIHAGFTGGLKFFLGILPLIILFSLMSGQIGVLYQKNQDSARSMMAGKEGIGKAAVIGMIIPGGIAAGPVLQKEWDNGGNKLAIVAFLIATTLANWGIILIRLPFLGEKITAIIFATGVLITATTVAVLVAVQHFK